MLATAFKGFQQQFKNAITAHDSSPEGGQQQLKGWPAAAKRHESRRMAWAGRADEMLTFAIYIPITAHYSGQQ